MRRMSREEIARQEAAMIEQIEVRYMRGWISHREMRDEMVKVYDWANKRDSEVAS